MISSSSVDRSSLKVVGNEKGGGSRSRLLFYNMVSDRGDRCLFNL
jgi:hypothetical protein